VNPEPSDDAGWAICLWVVAALLASAVVTMWLFGRMYAG
jgi:hypothetical protein